MTNTEIVKKLIGPIDPIGKSEVDEERFENLKSMAELVFNLAKEINDVSYNNKDAKEASVKKAADFSYNFLTKELGIIL